MKKVLFVAHVDSHIRHFHLPYLKYFKEKGYEVHVATSNDENENFANCDVKHTVIMERNPLKMNNLKAIKQMKELLQSEKFDLVHCHTPMGGVVTRLACKTVKKSGTKIIYTAHGFHFYHGAPLMNWLVYYPIEKYLSRYTDVIETINHEDFHLAKEKFHALKVKMIHGVGVDDNRFNETPLNQEERKKYENELGIREKDFVLMYVAELNKNKNQMMLIEAMQGVVKKHSQCKLFLIGTGDLLEYYQTKINELNLQNNVFLLGYRYDIECLLKLADLYVASSIREGLGLNLVEALLCGVPVLAKQNRGHNEIVVGNMNGFLFNTKEELMMKILELYHHRDTLKSLSKNARNSVKEFVLQHAYEEQTKIYEDEL